jgi:hypothetical protein
METKFQTSFIPKKALTVTPTGVPNEKPRRYTSSLFMLIAILLFVVSMGGLGGAYAWKNYLKNSQQSLKSELVKREKQFNLDTIDRLKQADSKITIISDLVNNHVAFSEIFDIVARIAIEKVKFNSMEVVAPQKDGDSASIAITGEGTSLMAVAFQSDVLSQLEQYGLRKIIKNPMLTNPTVSDANKVTFNFSAQIDPIYLTYKHALGLIDPEASSTTDESIINP